MAWGAHGGRVEPHVMCSGALTALTSPTCTPQGGGSRPKCHGKVPAQECNQPTLGWVGAPKE